MTENPEISHSSLEADYNRLKIAFFNPIGYDRYTSAANIQTADIRQKPNRMGDIWNEKANPLR